MTYTITWTRGKKVVTIKSFAGMILWVSDPKWGWTVGRSVERLIGWVESPARFDKKTRYTGVLRWRVSE